MEFDDGGKKSESTSLGGGDGLIFVDRIPCRVWRRCPSIVGSVLPRYLFTIDTASPGHVVKKLLDIAFVQVDLTGLQQEA